MGQKDAKELFLGLFRADLELAPFILSPFRFVPDPSCLPCLLGSDLDLVIVASCPADGFWFCSLDFLFFYGGWASAS